MLRQGSANQSCEGLEEEKPIECGKQNNTPQIL